MFLPSQYPSPTSGVLLTLPVFLFIPRWTDPVFLHGEGGGGIKSHPHPELFSVRGVMTMVGFILLTLGMSIPLSPPRAGICWAVAMGVSPVLSLGTKPFLTGYCGHRDTKFWTRQVQRHPELPQSQVSSKPVAFHCQRLKSL